MTQTVNEKQVNILVLKLRIRNEEIKTLSGAKTIRQIDIRPWVDLYTKSLKKSQKKL